MSKLSSSRSSLPQVTPPASSIPPLSSGGAGVGPFTSQYMVSHLQDLAPQHQEQGTVQGGREGSVWREGEREGGECEPRGCDTGNFLYEIQCFN